jgi:predicted TIM-barrel fold metal-dependent hydrolase
MSMQMEDLVYPTGKTGVTWLPEPERRDRRFTVVSCDDHLVEPRTTFDGRISSKFRDQAPRVEELPDGGEAWIYDGQVLPNLGLNAVVGRPVEEWNMEPTRFDEMRQGAWDPVARLADMDLDGVYASLNFPSHLAGFGGIRLQTTSKDRDLSLEVVRAWNDWHVEDWCGTNRERFIPACLTWLLDPQVGADEVRRNAERGVTALIFPEAPHMSGLPSIHTDHWDPIFEACQETDTVICLHVGSGGGVPVTSPGAPFGALGVLFGNAAMMTAIDWVYSEIPHRFPNIKLAMSEGGIGWVPALMDRFEHCDKFGQTWWKADLTPAELFRRNFWFCMLDDPRTMRIVDTIGTDRVMFEVDYPHADSCWPNSQSMLSKLVSDLPAEAQAQISWKNASNLFRHPVPVAVQSDPNAF